MIRSRWILSRMQTALSAMPVVVLCGPRQSGKTTLTRLAAPPRRYWTFDDLKVLEQAQTSPQSLLLERPATLDEVQRYPAILLAVKRAVDERRLPGDFLLTGSANLLLAEKVSESLAGRAVYLDLPPFCPLEWTGQSLAPLDRLFEDDFDARKWPQTEGNWISWLFRGGFAPVLEMKTPDQRMLWFDGYVRTYLERDLRQLSAVADLSGFQRTMSLAANQCARIVNQANLARDAAISHPTCHRYLNLLETGGMLHRVPAWSFNAITGLVKSPKLLWADCGLATWLAGIYSPETLKTRADVGFWLEQTLFLTLNTWKSLDSSRRRIYFWRDRNGNEVDFILEKEGKWVGLEIKLTSDVGVSDAQGILKWRNGLPKSKFARGVVLNAATCRPLGDQIYALPWGWMVP